MADSNILSDFGIKILEQEIDDVIFQTNEFLCDATFTGSQGPFWWILQMCMALMLDNHNSTDDSYQKSHNHLR